MKHTTTWIAGILVLLSISSLVAQDNLVLTLEGSLELAYKNNPTLQMKEKELAKAKASVTESFSVVLPQINGTASLQHAYNIQTNTIPNFFIQCDPDSFRNMYEYFWRDHYIPITLTYAGRTWTDVLMRIRGDSSRGLPKKSVKLKFSGTPFINGRDRLNFNADYVDMSYLQTQS